MVLDRRWFLRTVAATAAVGGLAGLAGCSSSCPDDEPPTPAETIGVDDEPGGGFDQAPGGSWPREHGSPGNTGYATGSLPAGDLAVRWRTALDLPATDVGGLSASSPTVGGGRVFVADSRRVHALSVETGEVLWASERIAPTVIDALAATEANTVAPTVGPNGRTFVGTGAGLVALDVGDGATLWEVDGIGNVAAPVVADGTVYALGETALAAVSLDGVERWRRSVERGRAPRSPAVAGDVVAARTTDGVRAFGADTGDERWQFGEHVETYPVIAEGACLVGNYRGLHAIDVASGERLWRYSRGEHRALRSPVVTPETIYAVEQPGEAGAASFALDRTDGEPRPRWCSYVGEGAVTAATDGLALGLTDVGEGPDAAKSIVAFGADLGDARWAIEGGSRPRSWVTPPAVLDGAVVVTTRGGTTAAIGGGG
ncbi:MAG: PQQ-binding-like beta-propeller repeat protein [Halanaeroarchaeum sp.]